MSNWVQTDPNAAVYIEGMDWESDWQELDLRRPRQPGTTVIAWSWILRGGLGALVVALNLLQLLWLQAQRPSSSTSFVIVLSGVVLALCLGLTAGGMRLRKRLESGRVICLLATGSQLLLGFVGLLLALGAFPSSAFGKGSFVLWAALGLELSIMAFDGWAAFHLTRDECKSECGGLW